MNIRFMGAAGVVTGSRTLVTEGDTRLLVDCGLFQGFKHDRERNWEKLPVPPLDGVALTHAHLDHSGWVPALVKQGYHGPVYCTRATADLLRILWPDAGRLQEEEADWLNRHHATRHHPALPLFDEADARRALERLVPVDQDSPREIGALRVTWRRAGHILGAASLLIEGGGVRLLMSGDLGRPDDPVLAGPVPPPAADLLVMESTYGDRLHPTVPREEMLAEVLTRTVERGGVLLVPSFAVGRAQSLLWSFHHLMSEGRAPRVPVVVDSPMATSATEVLLQHPSAVRRTPHELEAMTENVQFVRSTEESKGLNKRKKPFVLVSASGMLTGGRVLHHLANRAGDPRNTVLLVGYQAAGTRGARLLQGERSLRMFGEKVDILCEVTEVGGFSAHADADELVAWLGAGPRPGRVLLNHGEPQASDALRLRLKDLGYDAAVATERREWEVTRATGPV